MTGAPLTNGELLVGDARQLLRELPPSSVDCVITSPPYFALRDYGQPGQLGLEANVGQWVTGVADVCDELARVLKPTGVLWLNIGDSYSSHPKQGAVKKGLLLGPQRLAIELAERGWIIRNYIVWAKKNPMPSSVGDRFSNGHETVLFCVRSNRYFFDLDAVREAHRTPPQAKRPKAKNYQYLPDGAVPEGGQIDLNRGLSRLKARGLVGHPLGRNPSDVWHLSTAAYHGAHFATFPMALVERPLLATCPQKVCVACGAPWWREPVDRTRRPVQLGELRPDCDCGGETMPGLVVDPFMGAGTTALAAEQHGRRWLGIELNPGYADLTRQRIARARIQQPKEDKEKTP